MRAGEAFQPLLLRRESWSCPGPLVLGPCVPWGPSALLSLQLQLALGALEDPGRGETSVDPQSLIKPPAPESFTARAAAPWLSGAA